MRDKNSRNHGFGKQLRHAVEGALAELYGGGCFATQAAHRARMKLFVEYLHRLKIRDFRFVTIEVVHSYGQYLAELVEESVLAKKTATNRISSVNVILGAIRGDKQCVVSPSLKLGRCSSIRLVPPCSASEASVLGLVRSLDRSGFPNVATTVGLCRAFGLRAREAALLLIEPALEESQKGHINVTRGTKGGRGRSVDRWVPVSAMGQTMLERGIEVRGATGCLIPDGLSWKQYYQTAYYRFREIAPKHELVASFSDLRASWACHRYKELTGFDAPVMGTKEFPDRSVDQDARLQIANEMGHSRAEITNSYLGRRPR